LESANTIGTEIFTQTATRTQRGFSIVDVPPTELKPANYFLCVNQISVMNMEISYDERSNAPNIFIKELDGTTLSVQPIGAVVLRMIFEATKHTITATAGEHGTISPSGVLEIVEGGSQKFTFIPKMCYEIDEVKIDGTNNPNAVTAGSYTFTNIEGDHTIEVTFKAITTTYTVTVNANPDAGGDVSILENGPFACGTNVTVLATPNAEYDFVNWTYENGAAVSTLAEYSFDITANLNLTANFTPKGGIKDFKQPAGFIVHPNPAKEMITITRSITCNARIEIYSINGSLVMTSELKGINSEINISKIPRGIYTIRLIDNKSVSTQRFVKEHTCPVF
jgi:hypothetical protein